jgi:hypothetical protein
MMGPVGRGDSNLFCLVPLKRTNEMPSAYDVMNHMSASQEYRRANCGESPNITRELRRLFHKFLNVILPRHDTGVRILPKLEDEQGDGPEVPVPTFVTLHDHLVGLRFAAHRVTLMTIKCKKLKFWALRNPCFGVRE